jgi:hypothetical protein
MAQIPAFQKLWDNYPSGGIEEVKKLIGGKVDKAWIENSCAIRLSRALNYSDHEIPYSSNTVSGKDKMWYNFRSAALYEYLKATFGAPPKNLTHTGKKRPGCSYKIQTQKGNHGVEVC